MNKKTSKPMSSLAAATLRDLSSSDIQKKLAASILSQAKTNKVTSENMESIASSALKSNKYNDLTKQLAASALSQSTKKPWEK